MAPLDLTHRSTPPTAVTVVSRRDRVVVALGIGLASALVAYWHLHVIEPEALAFDFMWPWRAARALLAGRNPYDVIRPTGEFPFNAYFKYPLPAALVAIPFAWLPPAAAAAAFGGVSAGLLAYGLAAQTFGRLLILASPPFLATIFSGQWSALLMAGALLPALSWVAVCKPTSGFATFVHTPNRWAIIGGAIMAVASFLFVPSWVADWIHALQRGELESWYKAPVTLAGGQLLLLAALRWRRPEARYLLALSVAPQILGLYTGFLPMLVAETRREALALSVLSAVGALGADRWQHGRPVGELGPGLWGYWILGFIFLPALVIVLRRPNVSECLEH